MASLQILHAAQRAEWMDALARAHQYDAYHTPAYHRLSERRGGEEARLFVYEDGRHTIALPLLLRPIYASSPGRAGRHTWWDATSVYGYPGPVASHVEMPAQVVRSFQALLEEALREMRVVSVFSRMHPLIEQRHLVQGLGECRRVGPTVSIDLRAPVEEQRRQYRKNHRENINRLRRLGAECYRDESHRYLDRFVALYHETMLRVDAHDAYMFDPRYFEGLLAMPDAEAHLFVCIHDNELLSGGVFLACNGIIQYHLGGTADEFRRMAPMKLLFDVVREWGSATRMHVLHLGGGVGAREDSLFHFKAGFSHHQHDFLAWQWVVLPDVYETLCRERAIQTGVREADIRSAPFFPQYRQPLPPMASVAVSAG